MTAWMGPALQGIAYQIEPIWREFETHDFALFGLKDKLVVVAANPHCESDVVRDDFDCLVDEINVHTQFGSRGLDTLELAGNDRFGECGKVVIRSIHGEFESGKVAKEWSRPVG